MTQSQYTPAFHYQSVNKIIEENLKLFIQRFKMLLIVHSHTFQTTYNTLYFSIQNMSKKSGLRLKFEVFLHKKY